ncbi:MAG TPA: FAD-dependent oxidoreductase [Candidatus Binatia bacterium]|nr:FAD-dependent oxidoreductase [Candidatus Binatia bacterium]
MSNDEKCDVLIVGAGPAGLTAAIYSAWLGLKTIILETGITGGRAWLAPKIENFPGFPEGIKGSELVEKMNQQALRFNAQFKSDEEVVGLDLKGKTKKVTSRKQSYETSALIIATGTQRRKLRVPGETDFLGRGVSYCAVCDGPFFKNKIVAVVGNDEEAAIDALSLADISSKVMIVDQEKKSEIEGTLLDRIKGKANVETVSGQVTKIMGDKVVKSLRVLRIDTQQEEEITVNGVFVSLGGVPLTAIVQNAGIAIDRNGCLTIDRQQRTNIEGVFAAGDCTCGGMQVVTAAGEGAMAAMRASAYVRRGNAS